MATLRQLIEAKIKNANLGFKEVAGAANVEAVLANRVSVPSCYLFRSNNALSRAHGHTTIIQSKDEFISCLVITKNVRNSRGADSSDENELFCKKVQDLLLGWPPSAEYLPLEQSAGKLVQFRNGIFIWMDTYRTQSQIRSI